VFGIGGSEILVILVVALLFLGPDKLPEAAKSISKGIRDIKKHSRVLQQQIENDERIGGAIRDLKSALNGDEAPVKPKKKVAAQLTNKIEGDGKPAEAAAADAPKAEADASAEPAAEAAPAELAEAKPAITLPQTAGEADTSQPDDHEELAAMVRPVAGTVAKTSEPAAPVEPKHG
jgi:sec-independent protein translocase protein TatB